MSKVYGLWYGGASYSAPDHADLELFDSIEAAKEELRSRFNGRGKINYVNSELDECGTPGVDETSEMLLFIMDAVPEQGEYPDFVLKFGPRGGIRKEIC
jgi:hypothetical protein